MRVPFRLVDVFTDRPLAGNQLCVVPDAAGLSASLMQALAREIGFSETSFVVSAEPTATRCGSSRRARRCRSPPIRRSGRPSSSPSEVGPPLEGADLQAVAGAVGLGRGHLNPDLPPRVIATGIPHLIVPAAADVAVSEAQPDLRRLTALLARLGADGLYLFHVDGGRAHARLFAPGLGVNEDAATGSAAGPLGVYVFEHVARDVFPLTARLPPSATDGA